MSRNYERAVCADGFTISVQACDWKYCSPRNNIGPYYEVELGYPNRPEAVLLPYAENPAKPTETVYAYVPSTTVLEVLVSHGGFVSGELPPMVLLSDNVKEAIDEAR